jgi:hypothetical protein
MLLVYANYFETSEKLPPGAQKPEPIMGCQAADITAITWKQAGEIKFRLEIASGSSRIVVPHEMAADANEADGIARHFAELRYEMVVAENATDTAGYGIDENSPTVLVEAGNRSWELYLGSKTEIAGSYYLAKKDDKRVFMTPGYIRGDFYKNVEELRDRRWFSEDFGQIRQLSIKMPQSSVELRLGDSYSEWFIDQPASFSADGVAVAELIERLRNLRISNFVTDAPEENADYGFAQPGLVISVTNRDGRTFALEAGETAGPEVYVRRVGERTVHASLNSALNELKRGMNDLRDKYLALPLHDNISEITVADASGSITIERREKRWLIGDQLVSDADIKAFLGSLGKSRIFSFGPLEKLAEHGLQNKDACRYIDIKEPDNRLTLWMGTKQGMNLSIMNSNELMLISAEAEDAFKLLVHRIRREQEARFSTSAQPESAASASNTASSPPLETGTSSDVATGVESP